MVRVPGRVPHVPHPAGKGKARGQKVGKQAGQSAKPSQIGRGPELDAHAIATALAVAAKEAKEKELSFVEILQRVIDLTGIKDPQSAMEEANRRLQKEIDKTIDNIKNNKELMEEAEGWEQFANLLESQMSEEQIQQFFGVLNKELQ
ncbi:MAG: hypothetical protein HQ564_06835 [Candidatus Saganbacteria bacterium]|nr:hypothetical protein [Candidatus Saganbacteria bacterium]